MSRDSQNRVVTRTEFNKAICCLKEEIAGGGSDGNGIFSVANDGANVLASTAVIPADVSFSFIGPDESNYLGVSNGGIQIGEYTLPLTDGTANQVLKTDGSGTITWEDDSSGGGVPSGTDGQTLRFNGTSLESTSFMTNNGSRVFIGAVDNGDAGVLNIAGTLHIRQTGGGGNTSRVFNANGYLNLSYNAVVGVRTNTSGVRTLIPLNVGSTSSPSYSLDSQGTTDGWRVPRGTVAQRPTNNAGVVRWNTDSGVLEVSDGTNWLTIATV